MKNYLGRESGLVEVIRAVVGGNLATVGYTKRFRGITGYLFRSEELRKYRPVSDVTVPPEGFLNYREAASSLGIRTNVVRGLVLQGVLTALAGYRNGYSKLVPAKQVQRFAERYLAATVIAKHFNLSGSSFARYLRESGTPVLAVSIPDEGKGQALFLPKDTAANVLNGSVQTGRERNHPPHLGGTRPRTAFQEWWLTIESAQLKGSSSVSSLRSTLCAPDSCCGQQSIRRSYTPAELRRITDSALAGSGVLSGTRSRRFTPARSLMLCTQDKTHHCQHVVALRFR